MIYFDHNATTPLHPAARDAWVAASEQFPGNPASQHRLGQRADTALDDARTELARYLECDPLEIIWTSGATEASNTVFHSFARQTPGSEVWISSIEHASVLNTALFYYGKNVRFIPVEGSGRVSLNWIAEHLKQRRPAFVALMAANNETGVVQPWREAATLCRENGVALLCDATQWIGKLAARGLGASDFVIGSAHKFGGPRGVGFLKAPLQHNLSPLIHGGKQQNGHRAGTENLPGVLASVAVLKARESALEQLEHRHCWRDQFEQRLSSTVPKFRIISPEPERLWNTSMVILPNANCAFRWVVKLDKEGFAASSGSACASGNEQPSHVLQAMGLSNSDISNAVRFSAGWETPEEHWKRLADCIISISQTMTPHRPL